MAEQLGKREIDTRIHKFHSGQALLSSGIVFDILFLDIEQDKRFMVTDEDGEHIIRASEIYYLESKQRSTDVRTKEKFARCKLSIEEMKEELDRMQFYCPHKSYIVNMDYIQSFDKSVVILKNGEKVKVSRLKMNDFKEKFYKYLRSRTNGI